MILHRCRNTYNGLISKTRNAQMFPHLTLQCLSVSPMYLALQLWHVYEYIILDSKSLGMRSLKRNKCETLLCVLKVKFIWPHGRTFWKTDLIRFCTLLERGPKYGKTIKYSFLGTVQGLTFLLKILSKNTSVNETRRVTILKKNLFKLNYFQVEKDVTWANRKISK